MTKDEMLAEVHQKSTEKNYEVIQEEIKRAMFMNKTYIFVTKPGCVDVYELYVSILEPVIDMLKKDGFDVIDDPDNDSYYKICWGL